MSWMAKNQWLSPLFLAQANSFLGFLFLFFSFFIFDYRIYSPVSRIFWSEKSCKS